MKEVYYAGLDVHKDTVQLVVLGSRGKEPVSSKRVPNNGIQIVKELAKYQGNGKTVQAAYEAMLIKSPKQAILSAWKSNKPSPTWGNYGKKRCQSPFIGDWVMDQLRVLAFFVYEITADEAGNGNTKQNNSQKNLHTHFNLQTSF